MRVSAVVVYAGCAAVELAVAGDGPVKGERIADAQQIPLKFLEDILLEPKHARLVQSQPAPAGGYRLPTPAEESPRAVLTRAARGAVGTGRGERPGRVESRGRR